MSSAPTTEVFSTPVAINHIAIPIISIPTPTSRILTPIIRIPTPLLRLQPHFFRFQPHYSDSNPNYSDCNQNIPYCNYCLSPPPFVLPPKIAPIANIHDEEAEDVDLLEESSDDCADSCRSDKA